MAIKEIQLPLENIRQKLRSELKSVEITHALEDGADSNFHYTDGKADGIRLALFLITKEEQRLSKEA